MQIKGVIMAVIGVVIAVVLVPTIWTSIYTDAIATGGVNGTTATLLKLVPLIFVGAVIIGGILLAMKD
jgi:uncharacterized membrane protein